MNGLEENVTIDNEKIIRQFKCQKNFCALGIWLACVHMFRRLQSKQYIEIIRIMDNSYKTKQKCVRHQSSYSIIGMCSCKRVKRG